MNIVIFDTEVISIAKKFCYNVGYLILDTSTNSILLERDFVVEQIWHNPELFTTAYYSNKRSLYVNDMRARKTIMDKWGYIMQTMIRDFKRWDIEGAYAYNSPFDEETFNFNCEWFRTQNPFDDVPIYDILGYVNNFISNTNEYRDFCEKNKLFTESETRYSTTAETVYKYITNRLDFVEEHTALSDSRIEAEILQKCFSMGANLNTSYTTSPCMRYIERPYKIIVDGKTVSEGKYIKKYRRGDTIRYTTIKGV